MIYKFKLTEDSTKVFLVFTIFFISYNQLVIDGMSGSNWSGWCNFCILISIMLSLCLYIQTEDDSWADQLSEPLKRRKIWD